MKIKLLYSSLVKFVCFSFALLFHIFIMQFSFAHPPGHQTDKSTNSKIDSLLKLLKIDQSDSNQVIHLNYLSWEYRKAGNNNEGLNYGNTALKLAQKLTFQKGIADSYYNLGTTYRNQGNFSKSIDCFSNALKIMMEMNDHEEIATFYNALAIVYLYKGDYSQALDHNLKSLRIQEQLKNKKGIALSYMNIGIIYEHLSQYEMTFENYTKAKNIFEELNDKYNLITIYTNFGVLYYHQLNYDSALVYFFKCMPLCEKLEEKRLLSQVYNNIGNIYSDQKDYNKGLTYYFKSLKIKEELNDVNGIIASYINIGSSYAYTGKEDYDKCIYYLFKGLDLAEEMGAKTLIKDTYKYLADAFERMNDYQKAYQYSQLHTQIKDSLFNEESSKQIAEMQTKYETEKKEQQIKLLNKDKELQKAQLNRQKIAIWSVAGGLLIVLLFSYFIFKERKKSEKLLLNILPVETARELKKKGKTQPKHYKLVTVLFTDFKGFTKIAEKMSVEELVNELDFIFRKFDEIISRYPIEKIKTIGDAYMCAGGLPVANTTNPMDVLRAALDIQQFVEEHKQQCIKEEKQYFEIRIGVHSGPVVAGVVGDKKFAYDIWGDTVNTASRMESSGEPGKVNISGETYKLIKDSVGQDITLSFRGKIPAKNKGEIEMYFVERS